MKVMPKRITTVLLAAAALFGTSAAPTDMRQRAEELKGLRWGMFICWSFSTFSGKEWTPGVEDVAYFKATECDTDQWARTAQEAGMGYILFLTKHHDGFCLWDTQTTDRKVTKAPLGRDVLAELKKSCDKYGIKLALYFSEGEWRHPGGLDDPAAPKPKRHNQGGRNPEIKKAQLKELLTQYGPIEYIWFDHAIGDGGLSHADTITFCKSLQPGCFVGFNHGDQAGADIRLGERGRPGPLTDHKAAGPHMRDAPAASYQLAEFTYPILPPHTGGAMWFYSLPEHDGLCHPPEKLYRDYLGAVQYGNIFSINVGADYAGKLRAIDVKTLRTVGEMTRNPPEARVTASIDWPAFLGRHDLIWEVLPTKFDHGAFLGNGLLGTTIYTDGPDTLRFEIGRSDVTDHRRDNGRLPIGGMTLKTAGRITSGTLRTDLWNAETRGEVITDKGRIRFRAMNHADELVLLVDLESEGGEEGAVFAWEPEKSKVFRDEMKKVKGESNPPPESGTDSGVSYCVQRRVAGGAYATAWQVQGAHPKRRLTLTVADSFPELTAQTTALATVQRVAALPPAALEQSHRAWWHAYYPAGFLSVPDAQIEGFYWIQIYKLACATRQERQVIDLLGPWYRQTTWPRVWWNLNIQIAYSPVYTANRLELGESFTRFIDAKRDNFVRNAKEIWGFDGCATVPHTTDYEGLRGDGTCAPQHYINPGDFTWALFNYWQHYRYSMDEALVTNQTQHAVYPLLKASVNLYLHLLKPGDDGKLHLPRMHSPEYNREGDSDNNYNLSLLRWGCTTLLNLNARYGFNDPQRAEWERVMRDLVPYSQNENGFMIGATVPFARSHRHWSHLLMVWPLHLLSTEQPENKELVEKTLLHWLTVDGGKQIFGWSSAAAASLYASMGDGEKAVEHLRAHHNNRKFVMPNTMYIEGSPVIECSLVAATSLQDMLLQSWGDRIRIFPAVPSEWKEALFHDLRAEGAFLVSAACRGGKTRWVRIKSLAGEPCRVRPGFDGTFATSLPDLAMKEVEPGLFEIGLGKDQFVILFQAAGDILPEVVACALPQRTANFFGIKEPIKEMRPALSTGKPIRASSNWSAEHDAAKAVDGNSETRWGAAPNSRSGWLEIDLEKEMSIGGVEIWEINFPRVQSFSVEVQRGETWSEVARGTTINGRKTISFTPVNARRVRLIIHKSNEVPTLEELRVLAQDGF
ncbi:MAG: alpha-L-fucosidase [Kiritimatiellae bacterium]|nr:alpha-L-fucosidase [Kiritimatiellia bacterium]